MMIGANYCDDCPLSVMCWCQCRRFTSFQGNGDRAITWGRPTTVFVAVVHVQIC